MDMATDVLIEGRPDLIVPASDLNLIDEISTDMQAEEREARDAGKRACDQCGGFFRPRRGSGGKPQRFCSTPCRLAHHAEEKASKPVKSPASAPSRVDDIEHDWAGADTLFTHQRATVIYRNDAGDLVIRQERDWDEEVDSFVVISRHNVAAFLDKLCDEAGVPSFP